MSLLSGWFFFIKSDHRGIVGDLEENTFILYPTKVNPEAETFSPVIYFSNNTRVSGKKSSVKDLEENQVVKVWVEVVDDQYIAKKIKITKDSFD
ncbi:hypothetical protein [Bacillus sp. THAF10]|uniref:hypothetical protein n=1 Tax=Bacillus sp. THAF10 TaxID=2587848 RepID=UPI001C129CA0|nr:hypothetical protein [Bacillus sp. THAF10]